MDNADKITSGRKNKNSLIQNPEVRLFLQEDVKKVTKERSDTYDLEKEYAKTKNNKSYFVTVSIAVCILSVALITWGVGRYIDSVNSRIAVDISVFDDLNLKKLLDMVSRTEASLQMAVAEKAKIEKEWLAEKNNAEMKRDADLYALESVSRLKKSEREKSRKNIETAYDESLKQLALQYEPEIQEKNTVIEELKSQLAELNNNSLQRAQEQEAAIDSQRQVFELEKKHLIDGYEETVSGLQSELVRQRQASFEAQKKAVNDISAKYEAVVDSLDPVFSDIMAAMIVKRYNSGTAPETAADQPVVPGAPTVPGAENSAGADGSENAVAGTDSNGEPGADVAGSGSMETAVAIANTGADGNTAGTETETPGIAGQSAGDTADALVAAGAPAGQSDSPVQPAAADSALALSGVPPADSATSDVLLPEHSALTETAAADAALDAGSPEQVEAAAETALADAAQTDGVLLQSDAGSPEVSAAQAAAGTESSAAAEKQEQTQSSLWNKIFTGKTADPVKMFRDYAYLSEKVQTLPQSNSIPEYIKSMHVIAANLSDTAAKLQEDKKNLEKNLADSVAERDRMAKQAEAAAAETAALVSLLELTAVENGYVGYVLAVSDDSKIRLFIASQYAAAISGKKADIYKSEKEKIGSVTVLKDGAYFYAVPDTPETAAAVRVHCFLKSAAVQ